MMKICQVVPYFPYKEHLQGHPIENGYHIGGVERHVYNLSTELAKLNHEVTIITARSPNHEYLSDITDFKIVRIPIDLQVYSSPICLGLLNLTFEEFYIIHAHTPVPFTADLVAVKNLKEKKPFILTYHNDISKDNGLGELISTVYNSIFGRLLLNHSDIIIATTKGYAIYSRQLRKYLHKVVVVPNGVDINKFHPNLDRERIREKQGIDKDAKVVLFVGRLDTYKGCKHLLSAFAIVARKIKNAYLILVGRGPLEPVLRKIVTKLGIKSRVFFAGYVKDEELPYYYASCDVFVLPSISEQEGFGVVQLEAMACGRPVVATNIPGVSEVDPRELATIHVPPKDERALAEAILTILKNEELAIKMGINGRKLVEEKYPWGKVVRKILKLYKKYIDIQDDNDGS
ncbi:glycosyltransferase family 1 protein [Thermococci archaeon]|nr:MAG: glycosyltransferase family 1 protein [Thermococci archaeon]